MSSEKAGKAGVCLPYGTGGEQYVDERYYLHRTSCKQLVTARASATCDEKCMSYLLLRFCLSLFAKSAKVRLASLAKEQRAILPSQAENGLRSCDCSSPRCPLRTLQKLPAEYLYALSGRHAWYRGCQKGSGDGASPGKTRPAVLPRAIPRD